MISTAVDVLFNMVKQCTEEGEDRWVFLRERDGRPVVRAKEIGVELWKQGGDAAMHAVARGLEARVNAWVASGHDEAVFDMRQLEFCWNGIGGWQA